MRTVRVIAVPRPLRLIAYLLWSGAQHRYRPLLAHVPFPRSRVSMRVVGRMKLRRLLHAQGSADA